jgi:Na+:H+ antiporter, NhaA family
MRSWFTESAPIDRILRPFQWFVQRQAASGILLLIVTAIALAWANSPYSKSYIDLWHTPVTVSLGDFSLKKDLHFWINDGLMAVFFFVVGLEIKRELLVGELASVRKAALPMMAALGGMVVPALIYVAFNRGTEGISGWGVPMATDIAFAIGVLALLGTKAPAGLKVFLAALAIADDLGAVLVIAIFYTADLSYLSLAWAAGFFVCLVLSNVAGIRNPLVYALLGIGLWLSFLTSGVHATVAGVVLAMTIPARPTIHPRQFLATTQSILGRFEMAAREEDLILKSEAQQASVQALEEACERVQAPMQRLEHGLLPWINFFIMPVFALANAGVVLEGNPLEELKHPIATGVMLGLFVGKPIGITLFAWLSVRLGMASLPQSVDWKQIFGTGLLGGIGFTMSLFISGLAFASPEMLDTAKIGVFSGSFLSGTLGLAILFWATRGRAPAPAGAH